MASGLTLVGLPTSLPVAPVGGGRVGLGFGLSLSLYRSAITDLTTEATRGSVVSVGASLGRISSTVAPIAMGFAVSVADPMFGFDTAVRGIVAAAGLLCGAVGVVCLLVANRSPEVRSGGANPT
jgi:sugar phosphate permease